MDWIAGIQRAIDYMEENLEEPLDYTEIARRANLSGSYFQKVFSILCGCTVGEYIRSRRLTLAGSDLVHHGKKVIDVAYQYGYETPESFTRAFTRFHGVTPYAARARGGPLRSYARLSIHLSLKGGTTMNYRIQTKDSFSLLVKTQRFSQEDSAREIPKFWDKCRADGTLELLEARCDKSVLGSCITALCTEDTTCGESFPYSIGAAYDGGEIPQGMAVEHIPALTWAVFDATGAMPDAIQKLWHRIFSEFFPSSDYRPAGSYDLEIYTGGDMGSGDYHSEIWVAVQPR